MKLTIDDIPDLLCRNCIDACPWKYSRHRAKYGAKDSQAWCRAVTPNRIIRKIGSWCSLYRPRPIKGYTDITPYLGQSRASWRIGITEPELVKLIENGEIEAERFHDRDGYFITVYNIDRHRVKRGIM